MEPDGVERRLAAIFSADVVGYSRLMVADEAGTIECVKASRDLMAGLVRQHGGRVVDAVGDNLLAEFPSVVDAVACAVATQKELTTRDAGVPAKRQMRFRIGVTVGDVVVEDDRIYGDGVNIAARVQVLADPGGVAISGTAFEQVEGKLGLEFEDLGEQQVKNIPRPVRAYCVRVSERYEAEVAATVPGFGGRPAIAVLPFDNMSADPEQDHFADGIVEDLITRLSHQATFPVIARNSTFTYKGRAVDLREVSRDLGAQYVVEGSVRKAGSRVRITAQLVDTSTGHHVWAESYDRELEDVFAVQDEITDKISAAIEPRLRESEPARALRREPRDLNAWESVQRGWWHFVRNTKEDYEKCREWCEQAMKLDPVFAPAHYYWALSHVHTTLFGWSDSPERSLELALEAAEKALGLDENDAFAHRILATVFSNLGGQHERAIAENERAIALAPSLAWGYWGLGQSLNFASRPEEGIAMIQKAIRLSPQDPTLPEFHADLAVGHFVAGRYPETVSYARQARRERAGGNWSWPFLVAGLAHLDQSEEAKGELREMRRHFEMHAAQNVFADRTVVVRLIEGLQKAGWD
jgi:adenylate cyclase